ncbi:MAG TPA: hypothetical protein PKM65_04920 [Spirochaetota bacterium]|nr:hypothetical protein [Spirochaetota bacterium]HNT10307.1 hypothetical protein [Spirochaetota bacterium]
MNLFDDSVGRLRTFLGRKQSAGELRTTQLPATTGWPAGERGNIVLAADTGVELGNPRVESASFMVWTEAADAVRDGAVHVVGPDLAESAGRSLPFGKAVILRVNGMNEENCYERHRALELIRYRLNLKGYMMRAVSQYLREWSRVSVEAIDGGFSFATLAGTLHSMYRAVEYVSAVEFVFVTSSPEDVRALGETCARVERLIGAMNKMAQEMSFDCGVCDYTDVCSEVEDLRSMRKNAAEGGAHATRH